MEPIQPNRITKGTKVNTASWRISGRHRANFEMTVLLEIQYENKRPTLLWLGNVLTRIDPRKAGINIRAAAYPRPRTFNEARDTPSQMVRTRQEVKFRVFS
jgi:hypothetical protein